MTCTSPVPWTQENIDTLAAAMAGGIKKVVYDGPPRREVEYQTLSEMETLLGKMVQHVAGAAGCAPARRLAKTKKGFRS